MSESNVELARRGFEAVAQGDFDALREILDPGDSEGAGPTRFIRDLEA